MSFEQRGSEPQGLPSPEEAKPVDAAQDSSSATDTPEQKPDAATPAPEAAPQSPEDMKPVPEKIDAMKEFLENLGKIFEQLSTLMQEKFFPKEKDGKTVLPFLDGMNEAAGVEQKPVLNGLNQLAGVDDKAESPAEVKKALEERAAAAAAETAKKFDHPTFTRRPPKNEEVRPFYRQGPDGMIKEKWQYNSSTTEWTQVGSQTTAEIRTELQARREQRDAERQAARNSDPEGDQIFAMWRSGKYGSFLRRRANRRYVENNLGISVGNTSKAPDRGPYQKFSNYRVNDYAQEARRITDEKIKAPLTAEERASAEADFKKYGLFQNMPNRNNEAPPSSDEGAYAQAEAAPERNRPAPLHTESVEVKGIRGMGAEDVKIPIVIPASLLEFNEEQEDRTVIYYPRTDSFQIRRQGSELREAGVEIERVYTGEIDGLGKPELKGIRLHFTKPETFIVRGKKVVVEKKGESNEEEDAKEPPSPGVIPPRVA